MSTTTKVSSHSCVWCGNNFDNPKNTPAKSQVIWIRMIVRLGGELIRVRGAVCGTCRKELGEFQISIMKAQQLNAIGS